MMYEIEDGDSNEVCLAKTMLQLCDALSSVSDRLGLFDLLGEGAVYAGEVLNARAD